MWNSFQNGCQGSIGGLPDRQRPDRLADPGGPFENLTAPGGEVEANTGKCRAEMLRRIPAALYGKAAADST